MYFKLAEIEIVNDNPTIKIIKDIESVKINQLFCSLKPISEYKHIKDIYNITVSNGNELLSFLKDVYLNNSSIQKMQIEDLFRESNRLVANYCLFIGMFIDQTERVLAKNGVERIEDFRKATHDLYDEKFEYRFFVLLRNFIVHYSLPFTLYQEDFNGKRLEFSKSHLMEFSKWKHVKSDLEQMGERIDIGSYIDPMNVNLTVLFMIFVYHLSKEIVNACEAVSRFIIEYRVKSPAIVKYDSMDQFKKGNIVVSPINFKDLQEAFDDVKSNPHINLKINYITPDWLKK